MMDECLKCQCQNQRVQIRSQLEEGEMEGSVTELIGTVYKEDAPAERCEGCSEGKLNEGTAWPPNNGW